MEKIRKEFPVLRKGIYANTAVYGLLYESLLDWRQEHDLDFLIYGSDMRKKTLNVISDTRTTIGDFFNSTPDVLPPSRRKARNWSIISPQV